jgi:SAM-dependent methyltransferase
MPRSPTLRNLLNAWMLDLGESRMDKIYGRRKRALFRDLPREIVEIGPGAGANLRYYAPGTRVIAIEPNPAMHGRLREGAARHGVDLEIRAIRGEVLDLPDALCEAVVGTLVLCSVEDPRRVVSEVHRILKPGGRFVFVEHVAALRGTGLRRVQDALHGPWRWLFDGCNLNRSTNLVLREAGFASIEMDCFLLAVPFVPARPHILGCAVK